MHFKWDTLFPCGFLSTWPSNIQNNRLNDHPRAYNCFNRNPNKLEDYSKRFKEQAERHPIRIIVMHSIDWISFPILRRMKTIKLWIDRMSQRALLEFKIPTQIITPAHFERRLINLLFGSILMMPYLIQLRNWWMRTFLKELSNGWMSKEKWHETRFCWLLTLRASGRMKKPFDWPGYRIENSMMIHRNWFRHRIGISSRIHYWFGLEIKTWTFIEIVY